MKRALIFLGLFFVGACQVKARADQYPFQFAPKGEAVFFSDCAREHRECRWLMVTQLPNESGYKSVDSYSFLASENAEGSNIRTPCAGVVKLRAWVSTAQGGKTDELTFQKIPGLPVEMCSLAVPGFDRDSNAKGFNYVRVEQERAANADPVRINLVYRFLGHSKNRVIVQSGKDSTLFLEANFAENGESGYKKIRDGNAGVLDFESTPDSAQILGISSKEDWSGFGDFYRKKAGAVGEKNRSKASLEKALSEYSVLGLRYEVNAENLGEAPRLGYAAIVSNGSGDCKDLTVVMMRKLAENNIRSQPVLLGTKRGIAIPPALRNLPDLTWPSHVVVYLPDFDLYLDATLHSGKYAIIRDYPWYGAVGVNLDTQRRMIVGN